VSSILTSNLFKRVEPNAAWKLRWLLTPMVSGSNPATRTKILVMIITIILFIVSLFLLKREGLEEYGVAGMLVSIVVLTSLLIYYICTK
jgi:hypothetical protein